MRNYLLKATKNSCIDIMRKNSRQVVSADFITKSSQETDIPSDSDFVEAICNKLDYEESAVYNYYRVLLWQNKYEIKEFDLNNYVGYTERNLHYIPNEDRKK